MDLSEHRVSKKHESWFFENHVPHSPWFFGAPFSDKNLETYLMEASPACKPKSRFLDLKKAMATGIHWAFFFSWESHGKVIASPKAIGCLAGCHRRCHRAFSKFSDQIRHFPIFSKDFPNWHRHLWGSSVHLLLAWQHECHLWGDQLTPVDWLNILGV